tara:strand:+ start:1069 stop:1323 length:255 start_codon:yes stop_codon:yes gene_type:complete
MTTSPSRNPQLSLNEKIKLTEELNGYLKYHLTTLAGAKYHGYEHNRNADKVDISLTYKGQHYWIVILREGSKVPLRGRSGSKDR